MWSRCSYSIEVYVDELPLDLPHEVNAVVVILCLSAASEGTLSFFLPFLLSRGAFRTHQKTQNGVKFTMLNRLSHGFYRL